MNAIADITYDWANKLFMIVEDNDNNFDLLETFLKKTHAKIIWVKDGDEAVEAYRKNPEIDVILMDIQLPTVNGFEATKQIREISSTVPVIAQTAFALIGDREKSLEAGCNDYIAKPIRKRLFLSVIARNLI
nr:response regulator [Bacteroidota bacterium]